MNPTEHAAIKAIEAVQLDKSLTLARRREWQQVVKLVASIVGKPVRGPGNAPTGKKDKILVLLANHAGLPQIELYQQIATEVGCSASYVVKVAKGVK